MRVIKICTKFSPPTSLTAHTIILQRRRLVVGTLVLEPGRLSRLRRSFLAAAWLTAAVHGVPVKVPTGLLAPVRNLPLLPVPLVLTRVPMPYRLFRPPRGCVPFTLLVLSSSSFFSYSHSLIRSCSLHLCSF